MELEGLGRRGSYREIEKAFFTYQASWFKYFVDIKVEKYRTSLYFELINDDERTIELYKLVVFERLGKLSSTAG